MCRDGQNVKLTVPRGTGKYPFWVLILSLSTLFTFTGILNLRFHRSSPAVYGIATLLHALYVKI